MRHVVVSLTGSHAGFVDAALAERGVARRVALTVPNFAMALAMVAEGELAGALPAALPCDARAALRGSGGRGAAAPASLPAQCGGAEGRLDGRRRRMAARPARPTLSWSNRLPTSPPPDLSCTHRPHPPCRVRRDPVAHALPRHGREPCVRTSSPSNLGRGGSGFRISGRPQDWRFPSLRGPGTACLLTAANHSSYRLR